MRLEITFREATTLLDDGRDQGVTDEALRERIRGVEEGTLQMERTARETHNKAQKRITVALAVAACSAVLISIRLIVLHFDKP